MTLGVVMFTSCKKSEIITSNQDTVINGVVVDSVGDTLPVVNVESLEYGVSTTTDFDGKFTIDVPVGSKLVFSYISYETDTLIVVSNMDVTLHNRSLKLNGVGYSL